MKYALLASLALLGVVAYIEMRLRRPPCERCSASDWDKALLADWTCRSCRVTADHFGHVVNPN